MIFGCKATWIFLYEFDKDARWGQEFMNAWDELEEIVGRRVDLVSRKAVERSHNPRRKSWKPRGSSMKNDTDAVGDLLPAASGRTSATSESYSAGANAL